MKQEMKLLSGFLGFVPNQLNKRHLGAIIFTGPQLKNLRISPGTFHEFRSDFGEEFSHNVFVMDHLRDFATGVDGIFLRRCDQLFDDGTQFLAFLMGGFDPPMAKK
jgi:hypothetical protein